MPKRPICTIRTTVAATALAIGAPLLLSGCSEEAGPEPHADSASTAKSPTPAVPVAGLAVSTSGGAHGVFGATGDLRAVIVRIRAPAAGEAGAQGVIGATYSGGEARVLVARNTPGPTGPTGPRGSERRSRPRRQRGKPGAAGSSRAIGGNGKGGPAGSPATTGATGSTGAKGKDGVVGEAGAERQERRAWRDRRSRSNPCGGHGSDRC